MQTRNMQVLKVVSAVLVAVIPALFSYCKSAEESAQAAREADAGYKLLVQSVKHLEEVTKMQDAALILLLTERGKAHAGGVRIESHTPDAGAGHASGSASAGSGEITFAPSASPTKEVYRTGVADDFPELPANNAAALRQQSAD